MTEIRLPPFDLTDSRRDYRRPPLDEADVDADPFVQFRRWLEDAEKVGIEEPNAMALATATPDGRPSARMVLLKALDGPERPAETRGFVFFTHYEGRKGKELAANPHAALVFWWPILSRQVRIEGRVARVPSIESDAYFASRPRGSQLGTVASPQSRVIAGRGELEARVAALAQEFGGDKETGEEEPIPRPPHWGGYRLVPDVLEFWQGQPDRLHDRLRFRRIDDNKWVIERLAP